MSRNSRIRTPSYNSEIQSVQHHNTIRDEIRNLYGDSHHLSAAEEYVRQRMESSSKRTSYQEKGPFTYKKPASMETSPVDKVGSWLRDCGIGDHSVTVSEDMRKENKDPSAAGPSLNPKAVPFTPSSSGTLKTNLASALPFQTKYDELKPSLEISEPEETSDVFSDSVILDNLPLRLEEEILKNEVEGLGAVAVMKIVNGGNNSSCKARIT